MKGTDSVSAAVAPVISIGGASSERWPKMEGRGAEAAGVAPVRADKLLSGMKLRSRCVSQAGRAPSVRHACTSVEAGCVRVTTRRAASICGWVRLRPMLPPKAIAAA